MERFTTRKAIVAMLFLSISLFVSDANAIDQMPVDLGTAGNSVVFSNSGISTALTTNIGDIGVSLIAANEITEFSQIADHSNTLSIPSFESEKIYASDNANPSCPISKTNNACHQ